MEYNRRTASRIAQWMAHCKFKPIHVAILERLHAHLWHTKTVAQQLAAVREDRNLEWWELAKHETAKKRRRGNDGVHVRPGQQEHFDDIFLRVWGFGWQARLRQSTAAQDWRASRRDFVSDACRALGLPDPPPFYSQTQEEQREGAPEAVHLDDMAVPLRLQRDSLWTRHSAKPQLEFAVDNKTLADLINLEAHVTTPSYEAIVHRMRERCFALFWHTFGHKAGYLNTHDWRVRECNKAADLVCNVCLQLASDVNDIDVRTIAKTLHGGAVSQLYSDGGFKGSGASAFVAVPSKDSGPKWVASLAGHQGEANESSPP